MLQDTLLTTEIVPVHSLNRIVVRDEKGTETVRRASQVKVCDPKEKVTAMVPEHDEYRSFRRSTKLLLHTKDVPDLQFHSKTEGSSEIMPKAEIPVKEANTTSNKQYIVGCKGSQQIHGKIPPDKATNKLTDYAIEVETTHGLQTQ